MALKRGDVMRWKQIENEPTTFALIFETGEEIASLLQQFARGQVLGGSSFEAIGALSHAKLV
jgi:predicted DNA-binding protein with PD1-like motif